MEYNIRTSLSVKDLAYIFRDSVVTPDKFMFRSFLKNAKMIWTFSNPPRTPEDAFSSLEEPADWTYAVVARINNPRYRSDTTDFMLAIWDKESHRKAKLTTVDSGLTRSCARSVIAAIHRRDGNADIEEE